METWEYIAGGSVWVAVAGFFLVRRIIRYVRRLRRVSESAGE